MAILRARELLTTNLALIERAVGFACRRYRLTGDDAEEMGAIVRLKLVENDYAILRAFAGRCTFSTYVHIVVLRMALDYRIHALGKWHSSAEAKRLGAVAVELEILLHRDGRTFDEALPLLAVRHEGLTRDSLEAIAARLPPRAPRRREVAMAANDQLLNIQIDVMEDRILAGERRSRSQQLSSIMSSIINEMDDEDRLILQLRFEGGMTVAEIARALQVHPRRLYRRVERCLCDLRSRLEALGVAAEDVFDLIGCDDTVLAFPIGAREEPPS